MTKLIDKKYKNKEDGEIIKASDFAFEISLDGFKRCNGEHGTFDPRKLPKSKLIELGVFWLDEQKEYFEPVN